MADSNKVDLNGLCALFIHDGGSALKERYSAKKLHFGKLLTCALFSPTRLFTCARHAVVLRQVLSSVNRGLRTELFHTSVT
jgi:hypothetical protein